MARLRSIPGSAVTGPALWAAAKVRVLQWNRIAGSPRALRKTQEETLVSHCEAAADTDFGRQHELGTVRNYEDFKNRVPLRTYADFEPYIERMRRGAQDVLWPGLIRFYGQSSGTSNTAANSKFLPISAEQIRWQQKAGFDVIARYLDLAGDRDLTGGYILALLPPGTIKKDGPVGVASNPGIMQHFVPGPAKLLQLPKDEIRDIEDYDKKLTTMAEAYLDYDVRALTGTTCWFSILFDRLLSAAWSRGRKASTVSDIWPNLRVLFGGGVYAEPYRKIIEERVGRPIILMDNYNATEGGLFAATDRLGDAGMMMIPDRGVFFELVPREEHGKPNATRIPLWKAEPNVDYSVSLSTSSGLLGYTIGDIIRFSSVFPHRMEFAGRTSGVLSVTQELTNFIELERAVTAATNAQASTLVDFTTSSEVGIDGTAKGRYIFFIEFDRAPKDLGSFTEAVDKELCAQNRVYREHRVKDVAILAPLVVPLQKGATRTFMRSLGQSSVQQKFPRIVDEARREVLKGLAAN